MRGPHGDDACDNEDGVWWLAGAPNDLGVEVADDESSDDKMLLVLPSGDGRLIVIPARTCGK